MEFATENYLSDLLINTDDTEDGRTFIPLSRDKKIMNEIKSFMSGR